MLDGSWKDHKKADKVRRGELVWIWVVICKSVAEGGRVIKICSDVCTRELTNKIKLNEIISIKNMLRFDNQ